MRVLLYEHLSGGGLASQALPPALLREGLAMRHALLRDLLDLPETTVWLCHDSRLPPPTPCPNLTLISIAQPPLPQTFERILKQVDAAWLIAPESNGILAQLSQWVLDHGKRLLGSPPDIVALCSDKYRTANQLARHGIAVVPTQSLDTTECVPLGQWIVKPNAGVGGAATYRVDHQHYPALRTKLMSEAPKEHYLVQPYREGSPASLSALFAHGSVVDLSYNRMHVTFLPNQVHIEAITVNAPSPHRLRHRTLLQRIAHAMPTLWGYVGIDLIENEETAEVLEINPRLTLSYCGLRAALGVNVAEWVLRLDQEETLRLPDQGRSVRVAAHNETYQAISYDA